MYKKIKNKLMFKIMLLTTIVMAIILVIQYKIEQDTLKDIITVEKAKLKTTYEFINDEFYKKYIQIASDIANDEKVALAIKNNDRDYLLRFSKPIYENLKKQNSFFYNMHFHDKNCKSVLRVHKTQKYGDDLKRSRPMVVSVNKQKTPINGVEIGKHGISTRVAVPIFYKSEHVGSLEFGVKMEYFTDLFEKRFNTNSFFVFSNKKLTYFFKNSKNIDFKKLDNFSLFDYSNIDLDQLDEKTIDNVVHKGSFYEVTKNSFFLAEISKVYDYNQKPIGHIVFEVDINYLFSKVNSYRLLVIGSFVLFWIILYYVLHRGLNFFVHSVEVHQEKLEKISIIDELTNLYNRRKIIELINCEYDRSHRYKVDDTIILFDIDHFKHVNDTFGHNVGDSVLKEISQIITNTVRKTDHVGRWGGEEFIIIATETTIGNALVLANKLKETIEKFDFDTVHHITCSFGVANLDVQYDYKNSIHNADIALYNAKDNGRNQVVQYTKDLDSNLSDG